MRPLRLAVDPLLVVYEVEGVVGGKAYVLPVCGVWVACAADLQLALDQYPYKAWESISSRIGKRKWRVALPLAKNLSAWHYKTAYERWASGLPFSQHLDLSQGRPGQPALLPVLWETQPTIIFSNHEGERLDLTRYMSPAEQVTTLAGRTRESFEHLHAPVSGVTRDHIEAVLAEIIQ